MSIVMLRSLPRLQSLSQHISRSQHSPTISFTRTMASQSMPKTMKGVQISKNGGVDVLEYTDMPVPTPKDGEVLIKNEFIGVNYIDTYASYPTQHHNAPILSSNTSSQKYQLSHPDTSAQASTPPLHSPTSSGGRAQGPSSRPPRQPHTTSKRASA